MLPYAAAALYIHLRPAGTYQGLHSGRGTKERLRTGFLKAIKGRFLIMASD